MRTVVILGITSDIGRELAVRFVAISDARLDFSAEKETALVKDGLPYLTLVMRSKHWRVYAVSDPTPIVPAPATLSRLGPPALPAPAGPAPQPAHLRLIRRDKTRAVSRVNGRQSRSGRWPTTASAPAFSI